MTDQPAIDDEPNSPPHLIVRADASAEIGSGHLLRCLGLAHGWAAEGGEATFVSHCGAAGLAGRVQDAGFELVELPARCAEDADLKATLRCAKATPGSVVVLDGYGFGAPYQRRIKEAGLPLVVLDDNVHARHYYADIVLNQGIDAGGLAYPSEPYTQFLLGTRFVLLRPEFLRWRGWRRVTGPVARRLLVTLGGSDPENAAALVVQALAALPAADIEAVVVVGALYPHLEELTRAAAPHTRIVQDVDDMAELMVWADAAISGGGATCWELAFLGLPNIVLVLAANQAPIAHGLHAAGVSLNLGPLASVNADQLAQAIAELLEDSDAREAMGRRGRALVDGHGPRRVAQAIRALMSR